MAAADTPRPAVRSHRQGSSRTHRVPHERRRVGQSIPERLGDMALHPEVRRGDLAPIREADHVPLTAEAPGAPQRCLRSDHVVTALDHHRIREGLRDMALPEQAREAELQAPALLVGGWPVAGVFALSADVAGDHAVISFPLISRYRSTASSMLSASVQSAGAPWATPAR